MRACCLLGNEKKLHWRPVSYQDILGVVKLCPLGFLQWSGDFTSGRNSPILAVQNLCCTCNRSFVLPSWGVFGQ